MLTKLSKRHESSSQIAETLRKKVASIAGADISIGVPPPPITLSSSRYGDNVAFVLMSTGGYSVLYEAAQRIKKLTQNRYGLEDVRYDLKWNREAYRFDVNKAKAIDAGVSLGALNTTIATMFAGSTAGYFKYDNESYKIIAQMDLPDLTSPSAVNKVYLKSNAGTMLPLTQFISLHPITEPDFLTHLNKLRAVTIMATLKPGSSLGAAVNFLQTTMKANLPANVTYAFMGKARQFLSSKHVIKYTFLMGLLFIFLILAALFESIIDPIVILFAVPIAIVGALLTMELLGLSINVYSGIGLITLIGIIAKHGILIVDFSNRLCAQGKSTLEAVLEAARLRFRPVLMTTAAMVFGAVPLAFAVGAGSEVRNQIGWVIVGGLLFGTCFTLVLVPFLYVLLSPLKRLKR